MYKKILTKNIQILTSLSLILTLLISFSPSPVSAAALSSLSQTMSRQQTSASSSHVVKFTTPTALDKTSSATTIVITFPSDFDFSLVQISDLTMTDGPTTGIENTETIAASPSATAWGAAFSGTQNRILTLTDPTDGVGAHDIIANDKVVITYSNAVHNLLNATTSGGKIMTITTAGNSSDSGSLAVPIVSTSSDAVVVTATVNPTITFDNTNSTVGFGALSTSQVRYATSDTNGSTSDSIAHTMTISTNAASGYTLTYNGPTLTSGLNTITARTDIATGGTSGVAQFAISGVLTGTETGAMATSPNHYDHNSGNGWSFIPSTTTKLASATGPVSSDSIAMHYEANIPGSQPAGNYTTTINYELTGNF